MKSACIFHNTYTVYSLYIWLLYFRQICCRLHISSKKLFLIVLIIECRCPGQFRWKSQRFLQEMHPTEFKIRNKRRGIWTNKTGC